MYLKHVLCIYLSLWIPPQVMMFMALSSHKARFRAGDAFQQRALRKMEQVRQLGALRALEHTEEWLSCSVSVFRQSIPGCVEE